MAAHPKWAQMDITMEWEVQEIETDVERSIHGTSHCDVTIVQSYLNRLQK